MCQARLGGEGVAKGKGPQACSSEAASQLGEMEDNHLRKQKKKKKKAGYR